MKTSAQPFPSLRSSPGRRFAPVAWLLAAAAVLPALRADQAASLAAGRAVTLSVAAQGTQPFTYQWRKDGADVPGATGATYAIASFSATHAGVYTVRVANAAGSTLSDAATLAITVPSAPPPEPTATTPAFTTQPVSQSVAAGADVLLSAQASGSPSPSYRWRRNGVNLVDGGSVSGATTGTLTLSGVTSSDAATYTLVATNAAGSAVSAGAVLTVAAAATPPPSAPPPSTPPPSPPPPSPPPADTGGSLAPSPLLFPVAVAVAPNGEVYVADAGHDQLFRLASDGALHVLAGAAGQVGADDGTGTAARFNDPSGLSLDAQSRLIVADRANALVRLVDAAGRVTHLAGSSQYRGAADGPAASATFSSPVGVARAPSGEVYVADTMMHTIRRIGPAGEVTTFAGRAGTPGDADGRGGDARFNQPTGLAVDGQGVLYVADTGNNLIRRVSTDGTVSTVAGVFGVTGSRDGGVGEALFNQPSGLAFDRDGNLYVADSGNSTVRKISPQGTVSTFAGLPGVSGLRDGQGGDAWLSQPRSLAVDGAGTVYVADTGNARIRRISPAGAVTTVSLGEALVPPAADAPPPAAPPPSTPSTPAPSPAPSTGGGGGGGGGSTGGLLVLALAALVAGRTVRVVRVR